MDGKSTLSGGDDSEAVLVAAHVRPLVQAEIEQGCDECLEVTPGEPQVGHGPHRFTYDNVFGGDYGQEPSQLYPRCVAPLVDGLFKGFNATVFAYGQTGSGKTYTMGSAFPQDPHSHFQGVIPKAMDSIFARIAETEGVAFSVRVGFVEIHKEEIRDLLARRQSGGVHIRELPSGGIVLAGAVEKEVATKEEMVQALAAGTAVRATAATGMNKHSSRSHAIFTITIEQRKVRAEPSASNGNPASSRSNSPEGGSSESDGEEAREEEDEGLDDYLCAKLHLVDLAGSERVKRTKAEGQRLAEGIKINQGLLALGSVINALSEGKAHVPYRDSKLTRMLTDSLGGNSRTVMIACVSPADVNLEESLNTLRYANRARSITNKPTVNRDPVAAQLAALRQQLAAARAENAELRRRLGVTTTSSGDEVALLAGDDGSSAELAAALRVSEARVATLERELMEARAEAEMLREEHRAAVESQLLAALQRDKLARSLAAAAGPEAAMAALEEAAAGPHDTERQLTDKVLELEEEIRRLRLAGVRDVAAVISPPGSPLPLRLSASLSPYDPSTIEEGDEEGEEGHADAEELAHRAEMARVQSEMDLLERQLLSKEAAIAAVSGHVSMRESLEVALRDLASERDALARERAELLEKLRALQAASVEERHRLERQYKERLKELDARAKGVDRKERRIRELETAQQRALTTVNQLKTDIQGIKEQKAALQRQAQRVAREHAVWAKDKDRELQQLRKKGRASAAQLMRMEALHAKQLEVLRRKTEEAAAARKRLQLLEGRRGGRTNSGGAGQPSSRTATPPLAAGLSPDGVFNPGAAATGAVTPSGFTDEAQRRDWVESELDACCSSYELQKVLEGEKALRSEAARQLREVERRLAAVKNPQWWGPTHGGRKSSIGGDGEGGSKEEALLRKRARLAAAAEKHGRQIQEVQLTLVQARAREEERGGGAADASRWSAFSGAPEVRAMLTSLFRSASQYKAQSYEAQLALTEMSEEVEMLRLKLEVAEAEKLEASMRAAEAQAALDVVSEGQPRAPAAAAAPQGMAPTQESEAVGSVLQELNRFSSGGGGRALGEDAPTTDSQELEVAAAGRESVQEGEGVATPATVANEDDQEEYAEDEEDGFFMDADDESSDEDEADAWDPSQATPLVQRAKTRRRRHPEAEALSQSQSAPSVAEIAALEHLNAVRAARGDPPVARLTVAELRAALKGATVKGAEVRVSHRKREELLQDYIAVIEEGKSAATLGPPAVVAAVEPTAPAVAAAEQKGGVASYLVPTEATATNRTPAKAAFTPAKAATDSATALSGFSTAGGTEVQQQSQQRSGGSSGSGRRSPFRHLKDVLQRRGSKSIDSSSPPTTTHHNASISSASSVEKRGGLFGSLKRSASPASAVSTASPSGGAFDGKTNGNDDVDDESPLEIVVPRPGSKEEAESVVGTVRQLNLGGSSADVVL